MRLYNRSGLPMTRSLFWLTGVIVTAFVTIAINDLMPRGTFAQPFRAEIYVGSFEPLPDHLLSELGYELSEANANGPVVLPVLLRGTDFQRFLSRDDFSIRQYNYSAIRLRNFGRQTIENISIRYPGSVLGFWVDDEKENFFISDTGLVILEDMPPNSSVIIASWSREFSSMWSYGLDPNMLIRSSEGVPNISFVDAPRPTNGSVVGTRVWEVIKFFLFLGSVLVIGMGPVLAEAYALHSKKALLIDPDFYRAERAAFIQERRRQLLAKRAMKKLDDEELPPPDDDAEVRQEG